MTTGTVAATWAHELERVAALETCEFLGPASLWLCRQGQLDAAYAAGSEAIDLAPFVLGPFPRAQAHSALALVAAVRGDRALCEEHIAATFRLAKTADIQVVWLAARHAGALALLGDRMTDAALDELERLAAELERHHLCGVTIFPTLPELAETLARTGRTDEARATRDTWRRRLGGYPSTLDAATAARLDGLCAESIDDADAYLVTAQALFAELPYPFELARSHLYRGERSRRAGHRRDAANALDEARSRFEELGARAWRAQADIELGALGLRPKPTTANGLVPGETLSPQEHQVAMAASGGAATRDIAASLFISPKTVEAHLTRIYRKLGVASKAQLVAALGSRAWPALGEPSRRPVRREALRALEVGMPTIGSPMRTTTEDHEVASWRIKAGLAIESGGDEPASPGASPTAPRRGHRADD